MYGVVYTVTNWINGKQYVGQTTATVEKRWVQHVSDAVHRSKNGSSSLYNAIRKYGPDAFEVEAVIACDSQEELDRMEIMAIGAGGTLSPGGYNLREGGSGGGRPGTETRAKIGAALKGRPSWSKGKKLGPHTPEVCAKISVALRGKTKSTETCAKLSAASKGRKRGPLSPETRAKLSEAQKGHAVSLEARAKIGVAFKGKSLSPEHRAKLSAAKKGKTPWNKGVRRRKR